MRLNKFLALHSPLSRRSADEAIAMNRVRVNGLMARTGQDVTEQDKVELDNQLLDTRPKIQTIMLNKPVGYICSRDGQGGQTIYDLLPPELNNLNPVGRLDKHSSGLLLLSNDGNLAYKLTHPKFQKNKRYQVQLDKNLSEKDFEAITKQGVLLDDGPSRFQLNYVNNRNTEWFISMHEGRNRQIRRTFEALGYHVKRLHRLSFGPYDLKDLAEGQYQTVVN